MIALVAIWRAKEGEEERIAQVLLELVPLVLAEPGCRQYQPYRVADDGREFVLYEVYDDPDALEAHQATEHFERLVLGEAVPRLEERVRKLGIPL